MNPLVANILLHVIVIDVLAVLYAIGAVKPTIVSIAVAFTAGSLMHLVIEWLFKCNEYKRSSS